MIAEAREGQTYQVEVYQEGHEWDAVDTPLTHDEVTTMVNDCLKEGYDLIGFSVSSEERLTGVVGRWEVDSE